MNKEYEILQSSKVSRASGFIAIFLIIFLFFAPWWAGRADIRLLSEIFLYLSLASLWNLLAGYCGLVSVGQQAFVGLGGYLLFALTIFSGFNPFAAILVSGILGALISLPVAFLIFRLRGAYFAIGTWVVAEIFRLSFAQIQSLGGGSGSSLPVGIVKSIASSKAMRESLTYWMILGLTVFILLSVYLILRSRRGIALIAIRDNELASQSLGINILRSKLFVYVVTAGLTTILGGLIFLHLCLRSRKCILKNLTKSILSPPIEWSFRRHTGLHFHYQRSLLFCPLYLPHCVPSFFGQNKPRHSLLLRDG